MKHSPRCGQCGQLVPFRPLGAKHPLTKPQATILEFVRSSIAKQNFAPSFEEIAKHMGYRSLATVAEHLDLLEGKKYIRRIHGSPRAIEVLP